MRITAFLFLLQLLTIQIIGQVSNQYHSPLKIPLVLSGNFGELRSDHFHSGIDIKTKGTIGHHVSAIEAGYISRIKVQANGYGFSIYLAHPDGHTSVYGHLNSYREDIAEYVKKIQYQRQSHQVDIYLKPEEFPLTKGDFIAYSGNSGGSMGPHLHFEIRNSANQHPLNVLNYGFDIRDEIAPKFLRLCVYPLGKDSRVNGSTEKQFFDLVYDQGIYTIPWGSQMELYGKTGIGVEVYDFLNGGGNRCGIYTLEGFIDELSFYHHKMEEFSFSESRYVNAHIDYEEKINSGRKYQRLYRLPNDKLSIYGKLDNDGVLNVIDEGIHTIKILATDVAGNLSELSFKARGVSGPSVLTGKSENPPVVIKCDEASLFEDENVRVEIPANALYENLEFLYMESPTGKNALSPEYHIHNKFTALHKAFVLSVKAPDVREELKSKLIFRTYDAEEKKYSSAGGEYINGRLIARIKSFGAYTISVDTIAPQIIPLNGSGQKDQSGRKSLRCTITDDLSDIKKYEGYIDNRWALFEYDPKNDLLSYSFDGERISKNSEHELELYITDTQGNIKLYHTTFTW